MGSIKSRIAAVIACMVCIVCVPVSAHNQYLPRMDFATYKLGNTNANPANVVEAFVPLYQQPNVLTFTDLRYYNQSGPSAEGNLALGLRWLRTDDKLLGLYGSLDRLRSRSRNYFSQATVGFECWFDRFFIGGNGYMTIHPRLYPADAFNSAALSPTLESNVYNIIYFNGSEQILPGIDALLGFDMSNNLTTYVGGYYFHKSGVPTLSGPKVRFTYTWYANPGLRLFGVFDRIALEGQVTHDNVRQTDWYLGVRFSIKLGKSRLNALTRLQQHMVDMIRRDENVIDMQYTESQSNFLTNPDGSRVTVRVPTSYEEFATEAQAAAGVDIVGVNGTLTADTGDAQSLAIIRDLQINGGMYPFSVLGRPYSVAVGSQGQVSVSNAGNYLLNIQGASNVDLEQMTFENKQGPVLQTDASSTGALTIDRTILKGLSDPSNALVKTNGDSNVLINDTTFDFDVSSTGPGLDLNGSSGLVSLTGSINGNLNTQGSYLITMSKNDDLTISNATVTNTGLGGILNPKFSTNGHLSIFDSTLQGNGTTPIINFEDKDDPVLKNVTIINTNTTNTAPLILISSTADITLDAAELMLINKGLGDGIDEEGDLTIKNSTITEITSEPVIAILDGKTGNIHVLNSTITNLGAGSIFRIDMTAESVITIVDSNLIGTGAMATMMLGSSEMGSSTTLTNTNLSNSGAGSLIEHTGTAPLTLDTFIGLTQTGTGDGIVLANTATMGAHTLTLDNVTLQGNLAGDVINIPSSSTESVSIGNNVTLTNDQSSSLINHEGSGAITVNNGASLTLSHPNGAGDGIVLANTSTMTPQTFTLSNVLINGSMNGDFLVVPSTSTTSVSIENNSNLTNTGNGGILTMAAASMSADLTISNSDLVNSSSGDLINLSGGGAVNINTGATFTSTNNGNLISIEGATGNINVTGTSGTPVEFDTSGFAIKTNGNSFGNTTVEYVQSNAPFDFKLSNASAQGQVAFDNNTLTIGNSTAIDSDVVNDFASVIFSANDNSQMLNISSFSNNTIDITRTDTQDSYGIYASGTNGGPMTFTNGISNNTITLDNSAATASGSTTRLVGFFNNNMTLNADFSENTIDVTGKAGNNLNGQVGAIGMYSDGNFTLNSGASMTSNDFEATNQESGGDSAAWFADGPVVITGNLGGSATNLGNTFQSQNSAANGYGLWSDSTFTITGDIGYNTLTATSNGATSAGWRSDAAVTVTSGDIHHNTFEASLNGNNNNVGWQARGAITLSAGNISNNEFISNSNGRNAYAWETRGALNISGNLISNTFQSNGNARDAYGWQADNTVVIGGTIDSNIFNLTANIRRNRAIDLNDDFTLDGLFTNNQITITSPTNDLANGLDINLNNSEIAHFKQAVTGNTFNVTTTNTNSYDFRLNTLNGAGIYFEGNPSEADFKSANGNATYREFNTGNVNFAIPPP